MYIEKKGEKTGTKSQINLWKIYNLYMYQFEIHFLESLQEEINGNDDFFSGFLSERYPMSFISFGTES